MMPHHQNKQITSNMLRLHELLKEDQEPFHLKAHISQKRNSLLKKKQTIISNILCSRACFLKLHGSSSDDVTKSPFVELPSPANKSSQPPNGAVFLQVPSRTASLLLEAALRIQKHQKPKQRLGRGGGLGLFASLLKKVKGKSKERVTSENDLKKRAIGSKSCCDEEEVDDDDDDDGFCVSPFVFSFSRSPLPAGRFSPEFCSPIGSPTSRAAASQVNENPRNSENTKGAEKDEEKEQCSPVSVLDPPFKEDDEDHNEEDDEEDDEDNYNLESSYENVQRAKHQLLRRLRRFEKLAELNPLELERKLLEDSCSDDGDNYEPLLTRNEELDKSKKMSLEKKRLVLDVVEKCESNKCDNREVWFDTIDAMIELDFRREASRWKNSSEEVEDVGIEFEVSIFDVLLQELCDEMYLCS